MSKSNDELYEDQTAEHNFISEFPYCYLEILVIILWNCFEFACWFVLFATWFLLAVSSSLLVCCTSGDSIFFVYSFPHDVVSCFWSIPTTTGQYRPKCDFEEMEGRGGVTLVYENSWGVNSNLLHEW